MPVHYREWALFEISGFHSGEDS